MNFTLKKNNIIIFLISLTLILLAYYINTNYRDDLPRKLSESIFWLTIPISFYGLITLFLRDSVFRSWFKFTKYYFIISVLIVLIAPTSTHGLDFFPIVKETVTIFLSVLYSAISLILIIYKLIKND